MHGLPASFCCAFNADNKVGRYTLGFLIPLIADGGVAEKARSVLFSLSHPGMAQHRMKSCFGL